MIKSKFSRKYLVLGTVSQSFLLTCALSKRRLLHCAPAEASPNLPTESASSTSRYALDYQFLRYAQPVGVDVDTDSEAGDDDDYKLTSWLMTALEASQTIVRQTAYAVPALLRNSDNWSPLNIAGGVSGYLIGSSIKSKFSTLWTVVTCLSLSGRLLIYLGVITVNWDRVEELQKQIPLVDEAVGKTPRILTQIAAVPFGAFFLAGLLVGVRYG